MNFSWVLVESISIMNSTESATSTEMKYSDTIIDSATSTGKISLKTILHQPYHAL
jgi:hypothetical protein